MEKRTGELFLYVDIQVLALMNITTAIASILSMVEWCEAVGGRPTNVGLSPGITSTDQI